MLSRITQPSSASSRAASRVPRKLVQWMMIASGPAAGKQPLLIPWQVYPSMQVNGAFAEHLKQAGVTPAHKVFYICRSGVRSLAAGAAAQAAGFAHAFNVADGFEGPPDAEGHRGQVAGWKAAGMPWRQR